MKRSTQIVIKFNSKQQNLSFCLSPLFTLSNYTVNFKDLKRGARISSRLRFFQAARLVSRLLKNGFIR